MKYAVVIIVMVIFVALLAYGGFYLAAKGAERKSEQAWHSVDPSGELARRYTAAEKNEAATRAEELASALGIDLVVKELGARTDTITDPALPAIGEWLDSDSPKETIQPLPPEVAAWLNDHRLEIDTLARTIASSDSPAWPIASPETPVLQQRVPNLLGLMRLAKVLSVSALEREAAGDHAAAWEREQALWVVARGLLDRPEIISRLIGVAQVRLLGTTIRKLEPPAPAWTDEMFGYDLTAAMNEVLQLEFLRISTSRQVSIPSEHDTISDSLEAAVLGPYFRWATAESGLALMSVYHEGRDRSDCAFDAKSLEKKTLDAVPLLARPVSRFTIPSISAAVPRATAAELLLEGSSKVLRLKEARNATDGGRWPESVADIETSRCSAVRWNYDVDDRGTMRLIYEGPVPHSFQGRAPNLDFTVPAS